MSITISQLASAIDIFLTLDDADRQYLLDRFFSDAEISAESKRRLLRRHERQSQLENKLAAHKERTTP